MPAVQSVFLPPDPYAEAPAPQPASRAVFLPPDAGGAGTAKPQNNKAVWALIFGSGSLGLLVFSAGLLFFLTLPAGIWIALIATGEYSTSTHVDHGSDGGVHFDVIRLFLAGS